jgi:hypothetical protein
LTNAITCDIIAIVNQKDEVNKMNTYTIYIGATPIACVSGTEYAYEVWAKTLELAELICEPACLVWDDTAEEVASYEP